MSLEEIPQRLKPREMSLSCGTTEVVPFQSRFMCLLGSIYVLLSGPIYGALSGSIYVAHSKPI